MFRDMPMCQQHRTSLSDLPLFKDIKEALVLKKQQVHNRNRRPTGGRPREYLIGKNRPNDEETDLARIYIPPLSAYSADEETPYYPFGREERGLNFDELTMKMDQAQRRLKSIRTLGWNCIRPIGVSETMQQLRERTKDQENFPLSTAQPTDEPNGTSLPSAMQENGDESLVSFHDYNDINELENGPSDVPPQAELEQDEDEDVSYDYDAEFARVEGEEEEEEGNQTRNDELSVVHPKAMANRGAVRDLTIQQFVETSHIEREAYEIDGEYDNSQLDVGEEQADSRDFTEIPWVEVSDTVHSGESQRVSSLNSVIDRVAAPPEMSHRFSHFTDNNSDVE